MNKIVSILAAFLCLIMLFSCHSEHAEKHEKMAKLEVTHPMIKDTTVTQKYVCRIQANQRIEMRAMERGYLQKIFVDEGQQVRKGQNMFKIMPRLYEAELQKSKAEADAVRIEYQNTKLLADKNIVSDNELALSKAHLDVADAEVNLAQIHLGFTDITAPFSGLMNHLHVREGSLLEEGELLTTLSDNSKMWVYFNVPESVYLDYVSSNESQREKDVQLQMANGDLFNQPGKIEVLEGEFNNETGNIEFRAIFSNPDKILRHGETGNILMNTQLQHSMIIPQAATFEVLDKYYVFVVNDENKLEQRQITIAHEFPHLFVVEKGLKPTDRILIEGLRKVRNGDEIEPEMKSAQAVLADLHLHAE